MLLVSRGDTELKTRRGERYRRASRASYFYAASPYGLSMLGACQLRISARNPGLISTQVPAFSGLIEFSFQIPLARKVEALEDRYGLAVEEVRRSRGLALLPGRIWTCRSTLAGAERRSPDGFVPDVPTWTGPAGFTRLRSRGEEKAAGDPNRGDYRKSRLPHCSILPLAGCTAPSAPKSLSSKAGYVIV